MDFKDKFNRFYQMIEEFKAALDGNTAKTIETNCLNKIIQEQYK